MTGRDFRIGAVGYCIGMLAAILIFLLSGCASVPAPGTVLEKIVEPGHAEMVAISPDGKQWMPIGMGHDDEYYLVIEGRDSAGNPCLVRVQVDKEIWDAVRVGGAYIMQEEK